jgi:alpha-glucosidase
MNCKLLLVIFLVLIASTAIAADTLIVKSPDGNISFRLFQVKNNLSFHISYRNKPVIATSPLHLENFAQSVSQGMKFGRQERFTVNETYPVWGNHKIAVNRCNGLKVYCTKGNNVSAMEMEIRVFNDGVAFRHFFISPLNSTAPGETTFFNIPAASVIWYHDLDMHYESVHVKKLIDSVQEGEWLAPPSTFRTSSGIFASITEAQLVNYSGFALQANGKNGLTLTLGENQPTSYPYRLRYSPEDTLRLKVPSLFKGVAQTPWRVVVVAKDLNDLVNSDIVSNLNPAPDKKLFPQGLHTSWLKPGRAVWKYLDGGGDGTPEIMKHFADGAAALGFEHNIMEGFWSRWTDAQLKDVIDYSKQKGVGTWLWKHSKSLRNPASRDSFFKKCHDFGVAGIKIDFFDHEAKEVIDLYESILKEAAAYNLLLDFHGANKPTGLSRTYPNELTREAVKGMESRKITDRATHETTIPFTRMIAGPAEYTVLHFGERKANTTWAHQVASAAIMSAPMLTYAANPDSILANPAVEMIKSIPAVWDETIVLKGSAIGEAAVFARRKGNVWFLAVMNGNQPRKFNISLSFLKGKYDTWIAKDGATPNSVIMENRLYNNTETIILDLQAGGGFIARFSK